MCAVSRSSAVFGLLKHRQAKLRTIPTSFWSSWTDVATHKREHNICVKKCGNGQRVGERQRQRQRQSAPASESGTGPGARHAHSLERLSFPIGAISGMITSSVWPAAISGTKMMHTALARKTINESDTSSSLDRFDCYALHGFKTTFVLGLRMSRYEMCRRAQLYPNENSVCDTRMTLGRQVHTHSLVHVLSVARHQLRGFNYCWKLSPPK